MKKILIFSVLIVTTIFFASCTGCSHSGKRTASLNTNSELLVSDQNLILDDQDILGSMDSIFEKASNDINDFLSKYRNLGDTYLWKSEISDDKPFNKIRISGWEGVESYFLIIEKRSEDKRSTDVIAYTVEKMKEMGEVSYRLETSLFRNSKEIESERESFLLSTSEELATALKPFYKRLEEAKQDVQKNISRIEKMADKS